MYRPEQRVREVVQYDRILSFDNRVGEGPREQTLSEIIHCSVCDADEIMTLQDEKVSDSLERMESNIMCTLSATHHNISKHREDKIEGLGRLEIPTK